LVPDVGGSLILARAPGRLGEYLGLTAARMTAADAIHAGFADTFVPQDDWSELQNQLAATGNPDVISDFSNTLPDGDIVQNQVDIDRTFGGETLTDIVNGLSSLNTDFAKDALARMGRNDPLAMAAAVDIIHRNRGGDDIVQALGLEYRFTYRAASDGNFIEGIRALIIDKDGTPRWPHAPAAVPGIAVSNMLRPLGVNQLDLTERRT
ncbi:MAG: enoyl-CoA hydratase/isomerase family protein, partial [Pseudomonadota bacterium]